MKILLLSFYYEPDLCAGSFRNTALAKALQAQLTAQDQIEVVSTMPNRYHNYIHEVANFEKDGNISINRIPVTLHKSGLIDQIKTFYDFYRGALKLVKNKDYDLVYASSSRLFTAFLGARIARKKNKPLYLDIRDIFVDTMGDVFKNPLIKLLVLPVLKFIEHYTINTAKRINVVSAGFLPYFSYYKNGEIVCYTNGIDDDFLDNDLATFQTTPHSKKIITYAGNIGEGQGLEKLIPQAANLLGNDFVFEIIGEGGTKAKLEAGIKAYKLENVKLIPPMNRKMLIEHYKNSDYLLMHLNDYDAFKKVLPSKIFEYGATNKTIIAGVGGYAQQFTKENLDDIIVFEPGDVQSFVEQIKNHKPKCKARHTFVEKFKRKNIMGLLAQNILELVK